MKFRLLFALVCVSLFANSVYARTPKQEMLVKKVRHLFAKAETPSLDQLRFNHTWSCATFEINGKLDENSQPSGDIFKAKNNRPLYRFLEPEQTGIGQTIFNQVEGEETYPAYVNRSGVMVGMMPFLKAYDIVRITKKGLLVAEWAAVADQDSKDEVSPKGLKSIAYEQLKRMKQQQQGQSQQQQENVVAMRYAVCKPSKSQ